ncbi:MAG TPA: 3-deoxy-D-manno-octulosonic acid kinase [Rudaea sp.]|nr:3-deoxy-D-manno-octulosonic acid kinase [Rudaea sp.]
MTQVTVQPIAGGAIVLDPTLAAQAGGFDPQWFDADYWRAQGRAAPTPGGRGASVFIEAPFGASVLRHYRRGGMAAGLMGDRYLWTGGDRVRAVAEFRLLAALRERRLNVPRPIAARYRRHGLYYRADLITSRIEAAATLAELVARGAADAGAAATIGAALAEFHGAGAYHADLNAHNVLLRGGAVWLVDFDRGELRDPARGWQLGNLARLRRSLVKVGAAAAGEAAFDGAFWTPLMAAYERALARAEPHFSKADT